MNALALAQGPAASEPAPADAFRTAMRHLVSGVSLITHGEGRAKTGMTATSVSSLSSEPPTLLVCVNRNASIYRGLKPGEGFGISVLSADQSEAADGSADGDRRPRDAANRVILVVAADGEGLAVRLRRFVQCRPIHGAGTRFSVQNQSPSSKDSVGRMIGFDNGTGGARMRPPSTPRLNRRASCDSPDGAASSARVDWRDRL